MGVWRYGWVAVFFLFRLVGCLVGCHWVSGGYVSMFLG